MGHGGDATMNYDSWQAAGAGKVTFEDIDGFEWFASSDSDLGYVLIQEDSGNDYGERTFIGELSTTTPITYYFIAISGGGGSTRMTNGVGIPAGVNPAPGSHEFSGAMDLSGMLLKNSDGSFAISSGDGYSKRQADASVSINDKYIAMGLQAHNFSGGVIAQYHGDRGGSVMVYKPSLPATSSRKRKLRVEGAKKVVSKKAASKRSVNEELEKIMH